MQLICLNAWGGRACEALLAFLREHADATDIFCFQEVFSADEIPTASGDCPRVLVHQLLAELPGFVAQFTPVVRRADAAGQADSTLEFGLATLVRETLPMLQRGSVPLVPNTRAFVHDGWLPVEMRPLQYTRLAIGNRDVLVANVHGTADPGTKLDTPERLEQSRQIVRSLRGHTDDVILCGDFNLLPETGSIAMLDRELRNLVREYGITTTRSRLNLYHGTPQEQPFADYTFVSAGIAVRDFSVPDVAVSDHLPMLLRFE